MTQSFWSTVDCFELYNTRHEEWLEQEFNASVTLQCAWSDRFALCEDIRNNQTYPDNKYARFLSAKIKPFEEGVKAITGDKPQVYDWQIAHVTINYSSVMQVLKYMETFEPNVVFQVGDFAQFKWPDDTNPDTSAPARTQLQPKEAPGVQIHGDIYSIHIFNDDNFDESEYEALLGSVNDSDITLTSISNTPFNAEELLLMSSPVTRKRRTAIWPIDQALEPKDGTGEGERPVFWDYVLKYGIKRHYDAEGTHINGGWNSFFRAETNKYSRMYGLSSPTSGDPYRPYPLQNNTILLPPRLRDPGAP